jgi:activator of HSP90 ATPase
MSFNKDNYHWTEEDCTALGLEILAGALGAWGISFEIKERTITATQRMGRTGCVLCISFAVWRGSLETSVQAQLEAERKHAVVEFMGDGDELEIEDAEIRSAVLEEVVKMKEAVMKKYAEAQTFSLKAERALRKAACAVDTKDFRRDSAVEDRSRLEVTVKASVRMALEVIFTPEGAAWSRGELECISFSVGVGEGLRAEIEQVRGKGFVLKGLVIEDGMLRGKIVLDSWKNERGIEVRFEDGSEGVNISFTVERVPLSLTGKLRQILLSNYFFPMKQFLGMVFFFLH